MSQGLGRTNWFSEDAALLRREWVFELGAEHGPAAQNVYRHLRDLAQEQRDPAGAVLAGFRTVSTLTHVTPSECREFVEVAAALGLLDDFEVLPDGRRFTYRMSGWIDDQSRGDATLRKRDQRRREEAAAEAEERLSRSGGTSHNAVEGAGGGGGDELSGPSDVSTEAPSDGSCHADEGQDPGLSRPGVTSRGVVTSERYVSPPQHNTTPSTQKTERGAHDRPATMSYRSRKVPDDVIDRACDLLQTFNAETGRDLGAVDGTGKASPHLRQIVGALLTRRDVPLERWQIAIRNQLKAPPSWIDGELQLGHVFGERAAEWALANTGAGPPAGPRPVADSVAAGDAAIAEALRGAA